MMAEEVLLDSFFFNHCHCLPTNKTLPWHSSNSTNDISKINDSVETSLKLVYVRVLIDPSAFSITSQNVS